MKTCFHCGTDLPDVARFCMQCGTPQEGTPGPTVQARVTGSGAIAQGPGAVAAGERGVAIGGSVRGSIIITGDKSLSEKCNRRIPMRWYKRHRDAACTVFRRGDKNEVKR